MKEVEKLKKQIKHTKWLNKHFNKIILGIGIPFTFLSQLFLFINPIVSLIFMISVFLDYTVCGFMYISRHSDNEYLNLLEKKLHYAENTSAEQVNMLEQTIESLKENPTKVKDEQTTKELIKELIKIKKSAKRALQEQNSANLDDNDASKHLNNSHEVEFGT